MSHPLDLGVLIPTRNSMPGLRQHVEELNAWIDHVQQVVVVDSESSDGTLEYLREHIRHPNVKFLQHPPGLYPSWNKGVEGIDAKYTYVATLNDTVTFDGIRRLYQAAESVSVDVVLSPPVIVSDSGKRLEQDWPIHDFIERFVNEPIYHLNAVERLIFSALYLPGTLIGSSASNLYRTSCLKESPFSSDYGHAGDSAWAISRPHNQKWLIVNEAVSRFVMHDKNRQHRDQNRESRWKLYTLATKHIETLQETLTEQEADSLQDLISLLTSMWKEKEVVALEYQKVRDQVLPWFLRLNGWKVRSRRKCVRQELADVEGKIMKTLLSLSIDGGDR